MLVEQSASLPGQLRIGLDIVGLGVVVPDGRISIAAIFDQEREHIDRQLAQLTPAFSDRVQANLGIECVACFGTSTSSEAGRTAATRAFAQSGLHPDQFAFVLDFTTYAADRPGIWSLAHDIASHIELPRALCLGAHGSGCAGLHAALINASSLLAELPDGQAALLVAADRAPERGHSCLPISIMADAATALVLVKAGTTARPLARVSAVALQHIGQFANVLTVAGNPPRMQVESATFERNVMPLHFVMLHRVLARALSQAEIRAKDLDGVVYPNTTRLDRLGILRGFGFTESMLLGPGPCDLGHAFANDMLINASAMFDSDAVNSQCQKTAWIAAGSGFSWGAAIVEFGRTDATP